jgi:hypothetical protein
LTRDFYAKLHVVRSRRINIISCEYGALFSDPPFTTRPPGYVGRILVSSVALGCLRASGKGVGGQLRSHVFGMKKAAEEEDILSPQQLELLGDGWRWLTTDEGIVWSLGVVDRMRDVIEAEEKDQLGAKARL